MVKNVDGGSKSKSQARKFSSGCIASRSVLRLSQNNLEKYACVIKYFGQGRCSVKTVDNDELQCVIRKKFKGHSRRSSMVSIGTIILVGLREWEGPDNYKICDLLEVYDNDDYNKLKSIPSTKVCNLDGFIPSLVSSSASSCKDDFIFSDEAGTEHSEKTSPKKIIPKDSDIVYDDDDIDIDEI